MQLPRELHEIILDWNDATYILGIGETILRNHVLHEFIGPVGGYSPFDSDDQSYQFSAGNLLAYIHQVYKGASRDEMEIRLCEVLCIDPPSAPELRPTLENAAARSVANARIAELEAELKLKCDGCTSNKAVNKWKEDLECAVALTAELLGKPEQRSTEWHRAEWERLRGKTRDQAFRVFRKALPDCLKYDDPNTK